MSESPTPALAERVERESRALGARARLSHVTIAVAIAVLMTALGAWLLADGRYLAWPRGVPLFVWGAVCVAAVVGFRFASRRVPAPSDVARGIEHERGLRPGALRGAIEVSDQGALGARAAADVERLLGHDAVLMPRRRQQLSRAVITGATASLMALAVLGLSSWRAQDGFAAMRHPINAWRGLLLPALAFDGLRDEMPRGMPLTLRVRAAGRTQVTVSVRADGSAWRDEVLAVDPVTSLALLELGPVRAPLTVRVDDGRAPVLERTVTVGDRGWIGDVQVEAIYPAYLGRAAEMLELGNVLRVPRGTELRVRATAYSGARNVSLRSSADTVPFEALGTSVINARLVVRSDAEWQWSAEPAPRANGSVLPVEVPATLAVGMIADESPEVSILVPMSDTTISTQGGLTIVMAARDDHGLAQMSLTVQTEHADGSRDAPARVSLGAVAAPMWEGEYDVSFDDRKLAAGDRLVIVAQATDGSPWRQTVQSRRLVLRVPTAEEQRSLARSLADSLMSRAAAIAAAEKALQQSTSDASRSRELQSGARDASGPSSSGASPQDGAKGRAMSFESAEKMRAIAQQQRDLGSRVEALKDGAKELERRLSDAGAMDDPLKQRFDELQRMLREAMTPEMQQKLAQLEQSADRLSGSEVRQSLEQLAAQQKQMREQLEKSAEMLKRAALEGAMETLRDEAKELAAADRRMAEALSKSASQRANERGAQRGDERASEQAGSQAQQGQDAKQLADRTRRLEDEVKALTDRLRREGAQTGSEKTQAAQPDVQTAREAMRQAAEQLAARDAASPAQGQQQQGQQQQGQQQQGQQQQGQQGGQAGASGPPQGTPAEQAQRAAQSMDRAAEQLAAARAAQVDAWKQDLSQQLDQAINETAQLARQQSRLADKAQQSGSAQGMQGEQGAVQQGVQQAAERLEQAGRGSALLSQRSQRSMADAQQKVQQATQSMSASGQPGGSEQAQSAMRDAAQALNQALSSLVRDRERVNNSSSASGFGEMLEQMKQLAQQQGSLNGQMQGLSMLPGGAQGQQAQQQARALSRQQRGVAEGLQDVADIDPTGRLEALAREAQQVAQALDRGASDPAVAARQQQLYRRMLDAGRFLEKEERDDQGPREARAGDGRGTTRATGATSGKDGVRFLPPTWDDLRGLSPDERRLVYEYFRRLNSTPP